MAIFSSFGSSPLLPPNWLGMSPYEVQLNYRPSAPIGVTGASLLNVDNYHLLDTNTAQAKSPANAIPTLTGSAVSSQMLVPNKTNNTTMYALAGLAGVGLLFFMSKKGR